MSVKVFFRIQENIETLRVGFEFARGRGYPYRLIRSEEELIQKEKAFVESTVGFIIAQNFPELEVLNVDRSEVEGIVLKEIFRGHPGLKELELRGVHISETIAQLMVEDCPSLESLAANNLGDLQVEILTHGLKNLRNFQGSFLSDSNGSLKVYEIIATHSHNLEELYLPSANPALIHLMGQNMKNLTRLTVCNIHSKTLDSIATDLKDLTELTLYGDWIEERPFSRLAEQLSDLTILKLGMKEGISDGVAQTIASKLKKLKVLSVQKGQPKKEENPWSFNGVKQFFYPKKALTEEGEKILRDLNIDFQLKDHVW